MLVWEFPYDKFGLIQSQENYHMHIILYSSLVCNYQMIVVMLDSENIIYIPN
jgi:hypothetical protein